MGVFWGVVPTLLNFYVNHPIFYLKKSLLVLLFLLLFLLLLLLLLLPVLPPAGSMTTYSTAARLQPPLKSYAPLHFPNSSISLAPFLFPFLSRERWLPIAGFPSSCHSSILLTLIHSEREREREKEREKERECRKRHPIPLLLCSLFPPFPPPPPARDNCNFCWNGHHIQVWWRRTPLIFLFPDM